MDKKVKYNVDKFYFDNYRVYKDGTEEGLNIYENNFGKLEGGRQHDPIYNNPNAKKQVYTFGCSWTYGWYVEQEQTFTHLLGDENTAVHNYGAGGTGLDFAVKTLSEVYIPESRRQIFIITVPHYFRRTWFDDNGVVYKPWELKEFVDFNEYNNYFYFLHQYNFVNKFVGRDKIIWSCWSGDTFGLYDLIEDKVDLSFDLIDVAADKMHPGPKSHKKYADNLKKIIKEKYESNR